MSNSVEISFDDGKVFKLPCEYLRVYTPSAEEVGIKEIKPIGNYAIAPVFSDGHSSGIYTWDLLYKWGAEYPTLWADCLHNLEASGRIGFRPIATLPTSMDGGSADDCREQSWPPSLAVGYKRKQSLQN